MTNKYRPLWIVAALSMAVLVPLYGDPRRSPVTHAEWGRMMMRSLGFEDSLQSLDSASDVFDALAWKDQRNLKASEYKRGTGVSKRGEFVETGAGQTGEVAYDLSVVRSGDYNVRLRLRGAPEKPFKVEIRKDGEANAVDTFNPQGSGAEASSADLGWIEMEPGNHTLSVILPPSSALEEIEVSPPCLSPIEPKGGWRASALTTEEDLAVTILKALDMERELPPADEPIELRAGDFDILAPESRLHENVDEADNGQLQGSVEGLEAVIYADIPVSGLYAVSAFSSTGAAGQSWTADSCRRADMCPMPDVAPRWRDIMTTEFKAGRHSLSVLLSNGASVGKIRLQRLKTAPGDYVAALERVGFRVGAKGPVSRDKAREAMEWLRDRYKAKLGADPACSPRTTIAQLRDAAGQAAGSQAGGSLSPVTPPGGGGGGGGEGGGGGGNGGGGGVTPPSPLPPQPPASPVLPVR